MFSCAASLPSKSCRAGTPDHGNPMTDETGIVANPGVRFPPPLLFAIAFGAAVALDWLVRAAPIVRDPPWSPVRVGAGATLVAGGISLVLWAMRTFRAASTSILPHKPASQVVQSGPFAYTRNPMYVALTTVYVGCALLVNSLWPLLMLPLVLIALYRLVIRREERYLASAFGATYTAYCQRTRRWL
jgi:protein-S-isoprenylcysteine O-methyltransferase Ste14